MDSSFGARLKAQRDSQRVTLATIADRTKIRLALLDGLERDDVSLWPPGIFRRSYLRSYAAAIGLDPEPTVREFLALYPDAFEEPDVILAAGAESERPGGRPPMRLQYLIASAIGAIPQVFSQKSRKSSYSIALSTPIPARESADEEEHEGVDDAFELTSPDVIEEKAPAHIDLPAMAQLCTRIVEATSAADLERLLEDASRILHAVGIIVWLWDPARGVLWPTLSYGYSTQTLAKLPTLAHDADNAIGAAFRSSARQVVGGGGSATGAIVVPVMTPGRCAGVLAAEYSSGLEQDTALQALVTILAAQLTLLVDAGPVARTAIA